MTRSRRDGAVLLTGALLASASAAQASAAAPTVQVWRTTGDGSELLARQADAEFGTGGGTATVIDADETTSYQTVDGVTGDIETVAFRSPDGRVVLLALNPADPERSFQVRHHGQSFERALPAGAVTTFAWQP